jgi:tight adherence protein C
MNLLLIILGIIVLVLIVARLIFGRPEKPFVDTTQTLDDSSDPELQTPLLSRIGRSRTRPSSILFYFAPWLERSLRPIEIPLVELLGGQSTPRLEQATRRIMLAGAPAGLRPNEWLGIRYLVGLLGAFLGSLLGSFLVSLTDRPIQSSEILAAMLIGVIGALLGYALPDIWLSRQIQNRQRAIVRMIPEVLDLLSISVRAGLGLDAALSRVTERLEGPLPDEFRRALLEIRLGKTRREALRNIIGRTESPALSNFISGVIQAEQLGVPISRILQLQSEQLRIEHRQRLETQAARASIKMIFPMAGCIFPAIFAVILGPAVIAILLGLTSVHIHY